MNIDIKYLQKRHKTKGKNIFLLLMFLTFNSYSQIFISNNQEQILEILNSSNLQKEIKITQNNDEAFKIILVTYKDIDVTIGCSIDYNGICFKQVFATTNMQLYSNMIENLNTDFVISGANKWHLYKGTTRINIFTKSSGDIWFITYYNPSYYK